MKIILIPLFALALVAIAPAGAQTPAPGAAPKQKQNTRKEFREPKWLMDPVEGPNLHYKTFESKTVQEKVSYLLFLPPGYEAAVAQRYPVVYWLHGIGGSQQGVPAMAARLTEAIEEQKCPAMIVVFVNGMIRSGYADSPDGKIPVETVSLKELIPHIDTTYRTVATREGRIVEGFSMGGGGAAKWGFKYPEIFGTVSILAGAMWDPAGPGRGPQAMTDIPADNPWLLVDRNSASIRGRTAVRVVVGGADGLKETNTKFHQKLDSLGIAHEFHIIPDAPHSPNPLYDGLGEANWKFWSASLARTNIAPAEPKKP